MISNKTGHFEDYKINVKIKLALLWTSVTLCYLYGDYFELYIPNKVEGLISGQNILNTPLKLLAAAVLLSIPALMVILSVTLKPNINRTLNIIFGVFFTSIMVLIAITSLTPWRISYVFMAVVESILTAFIVRLAWKWPRLS